MTTSPDLQTLFFVSDSNSVYAIDSSSSGSSSSEEGDSSNDNTTTLPSATITVSGGSGNDAVDAALGQITYTSRTVIVDVSNVYTYHLYISGDSVLTPENTSRGVTVTGVNDITPVDFKDYEWGYAWGEESSVDENMSYYTPTSALVPLEVPTLTSDNINFTKKITFAAKFPITAASGSYKTTNGIKLSLVTTPKSTVSAWKDIDGNPTGVETKINYMQDITAGFCKNNDAIHTGDNIVLHDIRDSGHPYTIVKLKDGQCWMQDNLALTPPAGGSLILTPSDTNLAEGTESWELKNEWVNRATTEPAMKAGNINTMSGYKTEYGSYYNWCAATAGSCKEATTKGDIAPSSICPKEWHLPTGGIDSNANPIGDFGNLFGKDGINIGETQQEAVANIKIAPYNYQLAGFVYNHNGEYNSGGTGAYYWSSTEQTNKAYLLFFGGNTFNTTFSADHAYGYSVRCVADY